MANFNVGDKVRVKNDGSLYSNMSGTVSRILSNKKYQIRLIGKAALYKIIVPHSRLVAVKEEENEQSE